jgi:hypothetical protein
LTPSECTRSLLDVEDDVGHILAHSRDRGELVQHAVDVYGGDRRALQRGKQHPAQGIAERHAKAALERLGDHRRHLVPLPAGLDLELARLDQVLPILL